MTVQAVVTAVKNEFVRLQIDCSQLRHAGAGAGEALCGRRQGEGARAGLRQDAAPHPLRAEALAAAAGGRGRAGSFLLPLPRR